MRGSPCGARKALDRLGAQGKAESMTAASDDPGRKKTGIRCCGACQLAFVAVVDVVQEVKNFKIMLHELEEAFLKKHEEAQGSRERMKSLADKCVQAYNEAEKRKALGRPGIDPRMAAKKKKKFPADQPSPSSQEAPRIIFPSSMTGSKPKVMSTASE